MAKRQDRAWDSDALIGWLGKDEAKSRKCEPVIRAAEQGKVRIVVSTLALAEVIKLKHGHPPIPESARDKIIKFFGEPYIFPRNVDPKTSTLAREIVWDTNIDPKDAIHVATALLHGAEVLDTFDEALIKRSGLEIPGFKRLRMGHPHIENFQDELPIVATEDEPRA